MKHWLECIDMWYAVFLGQWGLQAFKCSYWRSKVTHPTPMQGEIFWYLILALIFNMDNVWYKTIENIQNMYIWSPMFILEDNLYLNELDIFNMKIYIIVCNLGVLGSNGQTWGDLVLYLNVNRIRYLPMSFGLNTLIPAWFIRRRMFLVYKYFNVYDHTCIINQLKYFWILYSKLNSCAISCDIPVCTMLHTHKHTHTHIRTVHFNEIVHNVEQFF